MFSASRDGSEAVGDRECPPASVERRCVGECVHEEISRGESPGDRSSSDAACLKGLK